MDTAQWPQANSDTRHLEIALVVTPSMEEMHIPSAAAAGCAARPQLMERRPRPQKEHALSCPRCQSTNTKFCYYNNYSLNQPRYFCKTCRRYWTEGGSLRNVPVGGGSRKNKRPSSSSTVTIKTSALSTNPTSSMTSSSATSAMKLPADLALPPSSGAATFQNPKFHEGQDLNLAFPQHHVNGSLSDFPNVESSTNANTTAAAAAGKPSRCSSALNGIGSLSHMELLRSEISAQGASPFMSMMASTEAGAVYPPVLGLQDFRSPTLGFSLDAIAGSDGYGNVQGVQEGGSRLFFPFEELRQVSSAPAELVEQNIVQGAAGGDPAGFWNGVVGGGSGSW